VSADCGSEGRGFEPRRSPFMKPQVINARVTEGGTE
jgi:hypothetical protein